MRLRYTPLILLLVAAPVESQTQDSMVSVPASMLTATQKQELTQQQLTHKIETYGKWVGLGDEVGKAVNSSLAAITTQTANFAETDVGKVTVLLVVWKIIGQDLLGIVFAVCIWVVLLPLWIWSLRRTALPYKHVSNETRNEAGKVVSREFRLAERRSSGEYYAVHIVWLLVMFGSTAIALFS